MDNMMKRNIKIGSIYKYRNPISRNSKIMKSYLLKMKSLSYMPNPIWRS